MKFSDFKNRIQDGEDIKICLFEGEDAYFGDSGLRLLREKFVLDSTFDYCDVGVLQNDLSALKDSLALYPLLSQKRLTCVREFYPKADAIKGEIKEYLLNPAPNGILVIINSKEHEALKKFENVVVVDCKKADRFTLSRWIKGYLNDRGVSIELEQALTFADYCLLDMTRIKLECDKICAYAGKGGTVTKNDIELMISVETEYKIYDMTDYIAKKQVSNAIKVISEMTAKGETPLRILSSIYNYFRRMLHVALSDKNDVDLAKELAVKEFAVKKTRSQAKMFKAKNLKMAVDELSQADYRIKSGLCGADEQMWFTIFSIMIN